MDRVFFPQRGWLFVGGYDRIDGTDAYKTDFLHSQNYKSLPAQVVQRVERARVSLTADAQRVAKHSPFLHLVPTLDYRHVMSQSQEPLLGAHHASVIHVPFLVPCTSQHGHTSDGHTKN